MKLIFIAQIMGLMLFTSTLHATIVPQGGGINFVGRYNNGYTEGRFLLLTEGFEQFFRPHFEALGANFFVDTDWSDGAVNAWAWKEGERYSLEIPGGIARYHTMSEEAFVMNLCHELGHLMGGAPASNSHISFEGQSDYFATAKCFKRFAPYVNEKLGGFQSGTDRTVFSEEAILKNRCITHETPLVCEQILRGALGATAYYAELEKAKTPSLSTPDRSVTRRTLNAHPKAQCRFDTMVAGAFCKAPSTVNPSWSSEEYSWCHAGLDPMNARPSCWYRP